MFELAQDSLIFIQEGIKVTAYALTKRKHQSHIFSLCHIRRSGGVCIMEMEFDC